MHIIDRRLNPGGKSLANRQRFIRRAKSLIRKAVHESTASRSIKDADEAGEISLPAQGVHEASFRRGASGGVRDYLLPGNKEYIEGDTIPRPPSGDGGSGSEGSPDGEGEDDFRFALGARRLDMVIGQKTRRFLAQTPGLGQLCRDHGGAAVQPFGDEGGRAFPHQDHDHQVQVVWLTGYLSTCQDPAVDNGYLCAYRDSQ